MSFTRLRRSCRYDNVVKIYSIVRDDIFYARQVGLDHAEIGKLKAHGDIIEIKGFKQKIITDRKITYKVSLYRLSQLSLNRIEEDIESGELPSDIGYEKENEYIKNVISSEMITDKVKHNANL